MPHVTLQLYPGRSEAQKASIAEALARALVESAGAAEASVSVSIEEVDPADWPDLYRAFTGKPERLYRKPGYSL